MNKIVKICLLLFLVSTTAMAQKNVNSYKYVIVPIKYEFQKSEDQYQVNSLTKFLFEKSGFTAYLSNEKFPDDLLESNCLALKAILNNNSGLFSTKVNFDLVDCYNNVVFSTKEGKTREKDYRKAYHEAVRDAFQDIENLNYTYEGPSVVNKEPEVMQRKVISENVEPKKTEAEPTISEAPKKVLTEDRIEEVTVPVVEKIEVAPTVIAKAPVKNSIKTITGSYHFGKWGNCKILKKDDAYTVVGGDENFEYATVFATSKPTVFIIKWNAYKQPQLVEITEDGSLKVDSESGVEVYKRTN